MNPADFKKTVLEIRKLAKKYTRDKSKKQFDYELFEYPFLEYVKKRNKPSYIISSCLSFY